MYVTPIIRATICTSVYVPTNMYVSVFSMHNDKLWAYALDPLHMLSVDYSSLMHVSAFGYGVISL